MFCGVLPIPWHPLHSQRQSWCSFCARLPSPDLSFPILFFLSSITVCPLLCVLLIVLGKHCTPNRTRFPRCSLISVPMAERRCCLPRAEYHLSIRQGNSSASAYCSVKGWWICSVVPLVSQQKAGRGAVGLISWISFLLEHWRACQYLF